MRRFAALVRAPALALLLAPLVLAGCDAGAKGEPGSDNAFRCPSLFVSTPFEGQQVVPVRDGEVTVLFDLQGATMGRGAGSKVHYRLGDGPEVTVATPGQAFSLGKLDVRRDAYVLTAWVVDKLGHPWTREETVTANGAPTKRTVNPEARVVRTFTVHSGWTSPGN